MPPRFFNWSSNSTEAEASCKSPRTPSSPSTISVTDTDGSLVDEGAQPLVYLHGGYGGIFPRIEEALQGKESAMRSR